MKENAPRLGQIIEGDASKDAIHIAVAPVTAAQSLLPGDHVNAMGMTGTSCVGVVDPFLKGRVAKGERFYLFLYPGTITGLRHEWSHPAFEVDRVTPAQDAMPASERWIRDYAATIPLDYDVLMDGAHTFITTGDRLCFGGLLEGEYVPEEFWPHYENVTGKPVPENKQTSFFTCAC